MAKHTVYITPSKYGYFGYLYSIAGGICLSIWQMCTHEFSIYNILLSFICICVCFCIADFVKFRTYQKNVSDLPSYLSYIPFGHSTCKLQPPTCSKETSHDFTLPPTISTYLSITFMLHFHDYGRKSNNFYIYTKQSHIIRIYHNHG